MSKDVEQAELGIQLSSGKWVGGMLFADDFVGVSDSRESLQKLIAERISARQYKSVSGYTYVRTYVRSSAQARTSRRSLRRRWRLDVYARARIQ